MRKKRERRCAAMFEFEVLFSRIKLKRLKSYLDFSACLELKFKEEVQVWN